MRAVQDPKSSSQKIFEQSTTMEVDGEEQQQSWARAEELQVVALLKVGVQGAHREYPWHMLQNSLPVSCACHRPWECSNMSNVW